MPIFVTKLQFAVVFTACGLLGCADPQNPVPRGAPIPGTSIVSCADDLAGLASATGNWSNVVLTVSSEGVTTLDAGVVWQVACPHTDSSLETEFVVSQIVFYRDEAGYPGEQLGTSPVDLRGDISCADRYTTEIGGASKLQDFAPVTVFALGGLCADRAAHPTGSPLYVQVEATGHDETCSSESSDLLFRSRIGVDCPAP